MVLRVAEGVRTGEDTEDLRAFVHGLQGCPPVTETVVLGCAGHGENQPTWTFVEADPRHGVARRRCLQCASTVPLLDSADRWTHPPMWACGGCQQSIAEVVAGLSIGPDDTVRWVVLAARCVECGRIDGLTDVVVPDRPVAEVLAEL